ncbi:helix-turn-helix domain-containing protein [Synergistes jonesii]|uniref:helix-turn-helix domain-containing protein n=1 Tax=Synergistes jonesii TaxID=2754 RepID=UPI00248D6B2E|nr:helix-turn-helix transcriptional regulator [Synergistes jonesii]
MIDSTKVRDLRLKKRLSQSELAGVAGISQTQLSRIEKGQGDTTTDVLVAIAGALGLDSADALLCKDFIIEDANPPLSRKVAARPRGSGVSRRIGKRARY